MPNARTMTLHGWGNLPSQPAQVFRPENLNGIAQTVADPLVTSLIARGCGRSYGDAAQNDGGGVLLQTRLDRLISFDEATGIVECESGVTFGDLIDALLPRGFFPPVTPGTKFVTIGGAIAADVHGKNHHVDGSMGEFVLSFELLLADGSRLGCSRDVNPDVFWATVGGMGLTGVILSARLQMRRVETAYLNVEYQKAAGIDEALALFSADNQQHRYSVAWIDCLAQGPAMGRSVLMRGDHANVSDLPTGVARAFPLVIRARGKMSVPFHLPSFALSPLSVRLFNNRYFKRSPVGRRLVDYNRFFYPLDSVSNWNRIYGRRGFYQYQAVFPVDGARDCLAALLGRLSSSRRASFLAVLKTMGRRGAGMLSFPAPGFTLALDVPNTGPQTPAFLRELDDIVLHHGGRIYLAKDACVLPQTFRAMYPRLEEFERIRSRLDPGGRFSSSLSRRLGIGGRA